MRRDPEPAMKRRVRGPGVRALAAAAILFVTIAYFTLVFVPGERDATIGYWRRARENTVGNLAAAVQLWVTQRLAEAEGVATLPSVRRLLSAPARGSASEGEELVAILTSLVSTRGARRVFIVDASLRVAARDAEPGELEPGCLDAARAVLASGVGAAGFHRHDTGEVATTFAAPVRDTMAGPAPGPLLGVVVIVEDPSRWLYPYLALRPGASRTGEAVLVRREGGNVIFLSPLRFDPAPPLTLRRPLATGFAAAEALGAREDFGEYRDYRGVAVLAALRRIPHTDWAIVSKIDRDEALASFRAGMWRDALMAGCLLLAVLALTLLAWRTKSARHHADLARTASRKQQFLQSILDAMPAVVFVEDSESRITLVNAAWERFTGVSRDQAAGKTAHDRFPVDVADRMRRDDVATLDADARTETEEAVPSDHGSRTFLTSRFPLRGEGGRIEGLVGVSVDITERKRVEETLREYERVVEGVEEMIVVVDRDYRYRIANRAFLDYHGLARDEVLGRLAPVVLSKAVFEREIKTRLDECLRGEVVRCEVKLDLLDLGERDLSMSWFPIEGPTGVDCVACVLQDITERKRAGEALQRAKDFAESVIETANVIFLQMDAAGIARRVNAAAEEITRYTRAEVEGTSWFEVLVPRDRYPHVWEEFQRLMREGVTAGSFENPILTKQGEERQILWRNTTLREGDQIVGTISFGMDVTDRRRAEEQQRHVREALQALSRRLVSAQETERRQIARELHDEAGQLVTGLKLLIESTDLDAGGEASAASELKQEIVSTADELLTVIRDISMRLRPPMLDDLGLVPTLTWYVQHFAAHTGVRVRLDCDPSTERRFGADVEVAAYRLVQESLTNVARHAMTETAEVELRTDGTKLQVRVSDSGRGFSPSEKRHATSLGLLGMRERCLAARRAALPSTRARAPAPPSPPSCRSSRARTRRGRELAPDPDRARRGSRSRSQRPRRPPRKGAGP